MNKKSKNYIINELKRIPGVGNKIAEDLYCLGIKDINDLKNRNPEVLYENLCKFNNKKTDRCMLYVFRAAIYYSSNNSHNPELLKWWNWKDKKGGKNG